MSCHDENESYSLQGRSNYSMFIRTWTGERFFADYPNRKLALIDAKKLQYLRCTITGLLSISLEDEDANFWNFDPEEGSWVQVYYDDDDDDDNDEPDDEEEN